MTPHTLLIVVKTRSPRFNKLAWKDIARLYHQWSEETYCSSWMVCDDRNINEFIAWATTAPCDRTD